ncbi:class I SAM-dependent methyltransferase [Rhodospirillum centenum]|uniref:Methyltransferase type 11 domain-containing protein n=1 Tax=Rhodospirillum centenum (strain ATCC 51521 / SW) TaxID=414684 RepID=B6IP45_RHOCS|nr:class I SAM-dependent methyltransferase [Rhodospirillum centenum]ACI99547.1 conserved hypothetical protein [Rhodospirillum centenum SW]
MSIGVGDLRQGVAARPDRTESYARRIAELYRTYLEHTPPETRFYGYIHAHSRNRAAQLRHVDAFLRYAPWLAGARSVLDWGCRQAVDSCLLRLYLGDEAELHGCDIDRGEFGVFHDFARLNYRPLEHTWLLPYADASFDAVVGSGALEHAAHDGESLKELWRVLRPDGHLVITFLPNAWSWTEAVNQALGNEHHRRRYRLGETKRRLMHHGFLPVHAGYHQVLPTAAGGSRLANRPLVRGLLERSYGLNGILERTWPVNRLAANLLIVARKVVSF